MSYEWDGESNLFRRQDAGSIAYSDGLEVEYRLQRIIASAADRSVLSPELAQHITDWPSEYHLSRSRHCLLRPLDIRPGDRVLEIGCGCGALTRYLGELGAQVVALEGSLLRAKITAQRCSGLPNVVVYADNLTEFDMDAEFDWVMLIGVLEYAPVYSKTENPISDYLSRAAKHLAPGGRLVVAIENKLGLKYFNGCSEDHLGRRYYGLEGLYRGGEPITFGRQELTRILETENFGSLNVLYPFPDYKLPAVIISDAGLTTPSFDVGDLLARAHARDYTGWRLRNFDDALAWVQLARNGMVADLSNSFLVVAQRSNSQEAHVPSFLAMAFSPNRVPEFATVTRFVSAGQGVVVSKEALNPTAVRERQFGEAHTLTNVVGSTEYIPGRQLTWDLLEARAAGATGIEPIADALMPWFRFLLESAVADNHGAPLPGSKEQLSTLMIDGKCLDCTPFNLIRSGEHLRLIDCEWKTSTPVRVGWVATRGLLYSLHVGVAGQDCRESLLEILGELCLRHGLSVSGQDVQEWLQMEAEFQSVVMGIPISPASIDAAPSALIRTDKQLASRQVEVESLKQQLDNGDQEKSHLHLQLQQLRTDLDFSQRSVEALQSDVQRAHGKLNAQAAHFQDEIESVWRQRAAVLIELSEARAQIADSKSREDAWHAELDKALSSRSWKLTRPIRAANRLLRARLPKSTSAEPVTSEGVPEIRPLVVPSGREAWDEYGRGRLRHLLSSNRRLQFPGTGGKPDVSIILVFYNNAHLSLLCLEAILSNADVSYEVVLVDNASNDDTGQLLDRLDGVRIVRNRGNHGFGEACMQGVSEATGRYICFLNNDALLEPGTLRAALENFNDPTVGVVGGKILFANGRLQEAGSILWSDGSAWGYGRDDDPTAPQYEFRRPVDYCSGAFLVTPTDLFRKLGGFSSRFHPAYYEDTDYCVSVWSSGRQVLYEPRAVIRHYESAASGNSDAAKPLMALHQQKFVDKWRELLTRHLPPRSENIRAARFAASSSALKVVYVDDRVPHRRLGSGFPRANDILRHLVQQGHRVTCVSLSFPVDTDYSDIERDVELVDGHSDPSRLLEDYLKDADIVWVSRPHNMERILQGIVSQNAETKFKIIYDAEAIFADRDRLKAQTLGRKIPEEILKAWTLRELALAQAADAVVCVTGRDCEKMASQGITNAHVVGFQLNPALTPAAFKDRTTFLFIGAMHGLDNPNADSMLYFCKEVWPVVRQATGATLVIAGYGTDDIRSSLEREGVQVLGTQSDLAVLYTEARVFVVPTRYAAGIPFKAYEAAAHGVPLAVSPLIGQQLGWRNGTECLIADTPRSFAENCSRLFSDEQLWERLRYAALARVEQDLTEAQCRTAITGVIDSVIRTDPK